MQKYIWPLDKVFITQRFGENPQFYAQFGMKGHDGIDLRTRFVDSPLARRYALAAADGVCEPRWDNTGYGYHVRVTHPDGSMTIYAHLSKIYVAKKQIVKQGQMVGLTGNTGTSTGAHLHFELRPAGWEKNTNNGYYGAVDPVPYLPKL